MRGIIRSIIGLGELSEGLKVLTWVLSGSFALSVISLLGSTLDFVGQMNLMFRIPFLVGAVGFAFGVFWLLFYFLLAWLSEQLRREPGNGQTALTQTSSSGGNIRTGDIANSTVIFGHSGAQAEPQPPTPPHDTSEPTSRREGETEPPATPQHQSPRASRADTSQNYFKEDVIYLPDFTREQPIIKGKRFEDCAVFGPALGAGLSPRTFDSCIFLDSGGDPFSVFWELLRIAKTLPVSSV